MIYLCMLKTNLQEMLPWHPVQDLAVMLSTHNNKKHLVNTFSFQLFVHIYKIHNLFAISLFIFQKTDLKVCACSYGQEILYE